MLRTIAGLFVILIDKIPELEKTTFILMGIIALKMLLGIVGIHISYYIFFAILVVAFAITIATH